MDNEATSDALFLEQVLARLRGLVNLRQQPSTGSGTAAEAAKLEGLIAMLASAATDTSLSVRGFLVLAQAVRAATAQRRSVEHAVGDIGYALQQAIRTDAPIRDCKIRMAAAKLEESARAHVRLDEAQLADHFGVHPSHLGRLFRLATGFGFREWRGGQLMKLAIRRRVDDNEQFAQIAYAVGFNHPTQFSREFRRLFGMSPREFHKLALRGATRFSASADGDRDGDPAARA